MKSGFLAWILSIILAFGAGTAVGSHEPDGELEQKVSDHVDVIVDEMAGIVDDVSEAANERIDELESEITSSDEYKKAEEFKENVKEIADDTKADIEEHFGDAEESVEAAAEFETEI